MTWIKNNKYANRNGTIAYVFKHPLVRDILVVVSDTGTKNVFTIKSEYFSKSEPLYITCNDGIELVKEIALKTILKTFEKEKESIEAIMSFIQEHIDKKYLTKDEALSALEKGKKIAHKSFDTYSYIYLDAKKLLCDSDGSHIFGSILWFSVRNNMFDTGWYIVE